MRDQNTGEPTDRLAISRQETIAGTVECWRPYPHARYVERWSLDGAAIDRHEAEILMHLTEGATPDLSDAVLALLSAKQRRGLIPRYESSAAALRERDAELLAQWPNARGLIDQIGNAHAQLRLLRAT